MDSGFKLQTKNKKIKLSPLFTLRPKTSQQLSAGFMVDAANRRM